MIELGVLNAGYLNHSLKKLDNGFVVPDADKQELARSNAAQIRNQVKFSVEAENLGFDAVFHSENHLKLLARNSPAPHLIQTAIAERTEEIRLIQMANILPWHDPVRLAEQTAMLDILSEGRCEVGVGTGFGFRERGVLGQHWRHEQSKDGHDWELFEANYEVLLDAWSDATLSYHSDFHDIPPDGMERKHDQEIFFLADEDNDFELDDHYRLTDDGTSEIDGVSVFPKPVQDPHPQLWRPAGSEDSVRWSARNGVNACTYCSDTNHVSELVEAYYEECEEHDWPDRRARYDGVEFNYGWDRDRRRGLIAQVPVFNTEVAGDDEFDNWKLGQEFLMSDTKSRLPAEESVRFSVDAERLVEQEGTPIVGDSEHIAGELNRLKTECGYHDFFVVPIVSVPGMSHEAKITQLEGLVNEVAPRI